MAWPGAAGLWEMDAVALMREGVGQPGGWAGRSSPQVGNEPVTLPVTGLGPYLSLVQDQRVTRLGSEFSLPPGSWVLRFRCRLALPPAEVGVRTLERRTGLLWPSPRDLQKERRWKVGTGAWGSRWSEHPWP